MSCIKIKILHIVDSFNIGGMENGLLNIIHKSETANYIHEICCIRKSGNAAVRLKKNIKIHEINKKEGHDWNVYYELCKVIKKFKPDIVHTRNWGTIDGILIAKILGIKYIIHGEHGWSANDPEGKNKKRGLIRFFLSFLVSRFIAVSEDIRFWLHQSCHINVNKITHIMNGVDVHKFYPGRNKQLKKKVVGHSDGIVIGAVGRLDPIKNFDVLIQAFSQCQNNNAVLMIVGDGSEMAALNQLSIEYGVQDKTYFLGQRDDLDQLYRLMDVFILPSQNEGISNTILEAMASGLPVIASRAGGNPELVAHNGTGLLVAPNSKEELTNAINRYIQNSSLRNEHGLNARKKAVSLFSIDQMVSAYDRVYRKYGGN